MASVMINQDLDSSVLQALRLLHSSDSDSEDQLRQLWKQSVIEKYGNSRMPTSVLHKIQFPSTAKRSLEYDEIDATVDSKKLKFEASSVPKSAVSPSHHTASFPSRNSSDSDADSDESDAPLEIYNTDGVCVKCKTSFSSIINKLVECVDCHKHYHQDCHFPPITDMDLSDPRLVWYCSSCEEKISATNLKDKIKNSDFSSPSKPNSLKNIRNFGSNFGVKSSLSSGGSISKSDSSPKHNSISSKKYSSKKIEKKKLIK